LFDRYNSCGSYYDIANVVRGTGPRFNYFICGIMFKCDLYRVVTSWKSIISETATRTTSSNCPIDSPSSSKPNCELHFNGCITAHANITSFMVSKCLILCLRELIIIWKICFNLYFNNLLITGIYVHYINYILQKSHKTR